MDPQSLVFPFDKEFRAFEKAVGETAALRAELELLRSVLMEHGQRDDIKNAEKAMYKRYSLAS